jgi:hypothetical protein
MAKREISMKRSHGLCSASLTDIRTAAKEMFWETAGGPSSVDVVTPDAWFHFGSDRATLLCRAWVREGGSWATAVQQRNQLSKEVHRISAQRGDKRRWSRSTKVGF